MIEVVLPRCAGTRRLESRMREIRSSGSEGGGRLGRPSLPLSMQPATNERHAPRDPALWRLAGTNFESRLSSRRLDAVECLSLIHI